MTIEHSRCTRCVLSKNFPKIKFDEDGVCNFCRNELFYLVEKETIDSASKMIDELINRFRGIASYDAVMCYSGGKDSTYTLQLAVQTYKLKVLAFTLDNGYISPVSFENIRKVTDNLGVDHLIFRPSKRHFDEIIKASALNEIYNPKTLTRISSVCNSCISIVNNTALKISLEKKIPFIIAGFTLGQIPANSIVFKNNYEFLEDSRDASLTKLRAKTGHYVDEYFRIEKRLLGDGTWYPHTLNLLCIESITENEIVENIKKAGWVAPKDVDGCSSNCRLNTFNNYVHEKANGYNPYELELSHLIRKGLLTRDDALDKLTTRSAEQLNSIMEELTINESDIPVFRSPIGS